MCVCVRNYVINLLHLNKRRTFTFFFASLQAQITAEDTETVK